MAGPREMSVEAGGRGFRAIVDALQGFSTILAISDADNQLIRANAAALAFIGRSEDAVIGHSVVEFLTPASRDEVIAMTVPGADDGPYGEHELQFERPDRSTVWGRVRTIRLKDDDGRTSLRISVVEDVTAQHDGTARQTVLEEDLRTAEVDQRATQAMIDAAVVAEGVETEAEATTLLELGYTLAQGFLFARPMAVEHLRQRVARGTVRSAA